MSANLDDCLKYVFGLSRTECECFEPDKPDDYNGSDSGIFLDELPGLNLNMIDAAKDCSANSLWNKMTSARDQAVKDFKQDLLQCIVARTKLKRRPFSGYIGDYTKFTKDLTLTTTYAGRKFRFADIVGGFAKLKRIGTLFNATGTVDLFLYNNQQSDPVATYLNVPTIANKISWFTLPSELELDMNSPVGEYVEYYLIYAYNSANKPKDMQDFCGTCGSSFKPAWNDGYPQYNSFGDKGNFGWANWMMVTGIKGSDLTTMSVYNSNWSRDQYAYGLAIDISFGCRAEKTICNEQLDYLSNPYALAMAYACRFKAGAILLADIMSSSEPNYYTILASELMPALRKEYLEEYDARVKDYLCVEISNPENINDYSDCFTCKDEMGFMKTGLLN